jgi:MoxR-like ATPase
MSFSSEKSVFNEHTNDFIDFPKDDRKVANAILKDCYKYKPEGLILTESKWKYMIRNVYRGKNIMVVGPSGFGKTVAVKSVQSVFKRPKFFINMGSTQDPRISLIGTTHFNKDKGTFFSKSYFVEAITTPNAIIMLDEFSRAHPEAWNIMITVLDPIQGYLRLDEEEEHRTVPVAEGVSFLATANVGNEYTATRVMDKAIVERFQLLEVDILTAAQEFVMLQYQFPSVNENSLKSIANIAGDSRIQVNIEGSDLQTMVSPRMSIEMAGLVHDGFSIPEAAEVALYPHFSTDGGNKSERVQITQLVQKYVPTEEQTGNPDDASGPDLFDPDEIAHAFPNKP